MLAVKDYTLTFSDPQATELVVSGGKGVNLARLTLGGLPVPTGFIITSAAYQFFIQQLVKQIKTILQHGEDVSLQSQQIQALIHAQPVSDILRSAIQSQLERFHMQQWCVAVRSSATFEDLPGAAFAGQHDTFLNQRGTDEIISAMRDCYASLWHEHAMRYRAHHHLAHLDAAMAVVVQQMVDMTSRDAAGVAFSIDPIKGNLNQVLINSSFGLGESVVGGEQPIDEFRVALPELAVVERNIGNKAEIILKDTQGVHSVLLPEAQRSEPSLSDLQCQDVAQLALKAQAFFGFPQDIEWAFSDGTLYLLQSRPITFIPERWTRDESAERFPNAVTPLTWDLVEEGFHESLNFSFELMGLPHFGGKWFAIKDFYIYGNQNAVELYAGRMPAGISTMAELQAVLPEMARRYAWVQELPVRWMRDLDTYLLNIGALLQEDLKDYSLQECWRYVLKVRDAGKRYFLPNIAISLTQRTLYAVLYQILTMSLPVEKAKEMFNLLLSTADTKTGQVNSELWALSRLVQQDTLLSQAITQLPSRELLNELAQYPEFHAQFNQFIQHHGHRELDFDAYYPTWLEAPHTVIDQIKILSELPDENLAGKSQDTKLAASAAQHQFLSQIPEGLRYFVEEVIRLARFYTYLDDLEHYQTTRITLPFRKGIAEIGSRLVMQGVLTEPSDIYFAPFNSLDLAISQGTLTSLTQIVAENKVGWLLAKQQSPVWTHGEERDEQDTPSGNELKGLAGSPGVIEGEVFLVHSPDDFALFPKGAILVARTTNPAWTSLFYRASGVITESGGPLSHGAVTARELQLPAVMSVRGVMNRLQNGMRVRLDGKTGVINLL